MPSLTWCPSSIGRRSSTRELRRRPAILNHERTAEARKLFADAHQLLEQSVSDKLLTARAVYGFFPANRVGDDVELYTDESRTKVLLTFHFLRQQIEKPNSQASFCLADFIAPRGSELSDSKFQVPDHLGAFAVTSGHRLAEIVEKFKQDHDDYNAIMAEALADRLAEAFAECCGKRVREEWGYGKARTSPPRPHRGKYRGIRPAAGYPACPDHTEKHTPLQLLEVEKNAGIVLTESFAMWPGSSVSGLYFAHPESKYFAVGKLGRDQILDYHLRKGMTLQEVEKWLGPWLNYDPTKVSALSPAIGCACGASH
jgi:5-methyltetrahydrofolate--homocysteine methyltransferase